MNRAEESAQAEELFIDGDKLVLGRLASYVAKRILEGSRVTVVNAEKIVVKASWSAIQKEWQHRFELRSIINPFRYSPKRYVRPDNYFRKVVRGMLPARKTKGKNALKRLRVYIGVPSELSSKTFRKIEFADVKAVKGYQTLSTISSRFGWKKDVILNG
jgi:large subunit ribosomal protein L13